MKKGFLFALILGGWLFGFSAVAQDGYTEGPVSRLILLRVKPGRFDAFMQDLRENVKPIWEREKEEGLITDYKVYLNSTSDTTADWDVALELQYKNYAALDGLRAKIQDLTLKHYGSKEKRQQSTEQRIQNAELVASRLIQQINLK